MSKQSSASVEPQLRGWNQFLKLSATPEASRVEKANESQVFRAREPSVVRKEAISQLPTGLRTNHTAILGATTLEFGLYYGQTFRWALENATGWVVGVVAKVMEEPKVDSFIEANKKLLERYALTFPLVKGEVEYKLASLKSTKDVYETGDVGLTLVRFGEFRDLSWRSCPCLAEKSTGGCVSPAARRTSPRKASASASSTASATPAYRRVPSASWLLFVYVADCSTRLAELKANITSTFGTVLKMDSTKRVVRKLSGSAGGTAAWATNVDNEHGQGLKDMTRGLVSRYQAAGVPPPQLLYVDRDCCCKFHMWAKNFFPQCENLLVRLDIWHFMRRLASCVTTESHPLYGTFMSRLSATIFR
ncbi:hypothetical protein RRG08_008976 [Elysia crispata]|uniref:Uncharacterized protein n=1 Tax=Elysia crispata TaxID=231223 RepID=A0AAE1AHI9_9GAST|nr:hypothetical protein RRG08_008976 [Elysia crispata]